jgi:UDP-glucose 4-epimerase
MENPGRNIGESKFMEKKIVVTGAAGYIAAKFLRKLNEQGGAGDVVGLDIKLPDNPIEGVKYRIGDMLSPDWSTIIEEENPDVLVHLAFVVDPMHDESLMHRINVEGTKNTFEAAIAAGVRHLLCLSSATAYGAFADNPLPLTEESPIRGDLCDFQYAKDKGILEHYCRDFARENPSCKLSIVRPVIVYGPSVENYLSRFIYAFPVVPLVGGGNTPVQFVHEDDVAGVMVRILEQELGGAFNVAGTEWMTLREVCRLAKRPAIAVPRSILKALITLLWKLGSHRVETPPSIIDFLEHPWVVNTDRVREELGYRMQYSSRDAVMEMIQSRK